MDQKQKKWLGWVKRENREQCEWVIEKMRERGVNVLHDPLKHDPYDSIQLVTEFWLDTEQCRDFARKLNDAWWSHVYRKAKTGKRTYNFLMAKSIGQNLKILAMRRGINRSEFVEGIILDSYQFEQEARRLAKEAVVQELSQKDAEIATLKNSLKVAREKPKKLPIPGNQLPELAGIKRVADARLHKLCEYQVQLRDKGIAEPLTLAQEIEAHQMYQRVLEGGIDVPILTVPKEEEPGLVTQSVDSELPAPYMPSVKATNSATAEYSEPSIQAVAIVTSELDISLLTREQAFEEALAMLVEPDYDEPVNDPRWELLCEHIAKQDQPGADQFTFPKIIRRIKSELYDECRSRVTPAWDSDAPEND